MDEIGYCDCKIVDGCEIYMNFNDSYVLEEVLIKKFVYSTTVYPAIDYIGMTLGEVVSLYGYGYNYGIVEGGYFINYDFANGLWLHAGANADENGIKDFNDKINYIFVLDGMVTENISIGMTTSQIRNLTGLDITLEVN